MWLRAKPKHVCYAFHPGSRHNDSEKQIILDWNSCRHLLWFFFLLPILKRLTPVFINLKSSFWLFFFIFIFLLSTFSLSASFSKNKLVFYQKSWGEMRQSSTQSFWLNNSKSAEIKSTFIWLFFFPLVASNRAGIILITSCGHQCSVSKWCATLSSLSS